MSSKKGRLVLGALGASLIAAVIWLLTTDQAAIWPVRNTLEYHILSTWWEWTGPPQRGEPGTLRGQVQNRQGQPVPGAWILVSRWDGTHYTARSDRDGTYVIENIPAGRYRPVAGSPGYESALLGSPWGGIGISQEAVTTADVLLRDQVPRQIRPGRDLVLGRPTTLNCQRPVETKATRRQVTFDNAGQANQLTLYYTPVTATTTSALPILLAVYPGPADGWECASLALAEAGYAVLGIGPAYSFDLEKDIDELERLVSFARDGLFPGTDSNRIALLGGSYSAIHVQRLIQRSQAYQAALLLGPPTDLFDMRRRLENGTYIPPFDLDQALIALGLPDREPLRYWRYSGAYHVQSDFPPLALLHSRSDRVVPYQQSELLAANLARVDAPYEIHLFEGASHYLLASEGETADLTIYDLTLDFLARHLQ